MNLQPIETRWRGFRFRSRLEARWAVFFDALGVKWEYEPQGFRTSAGPYLPDFKVDGFWAEVKPKPFTPAEFLKLADLSRCSLAYGLMLVGLPDFARYEYIEFDESNELRGTLIFPSSSNRNRFWYQPSPEEVEDLRGCRRYVDAVQAARSARFEFEDSDARLLTTH